MSNNGIVKFLASTKAIISILVIIVALVAWLVTMRSDVQTNTKKDLSQDITVETMNESVQENSKALVGVGAKIEAVDDKVERIDRRQEAIRTETNTRLDRIYEKIK